MNSDLPPDFWKDTFLHDAPASLALGLLAQIEAKDMECACWMVSALEKLSRAKEAPTLPDLLTILEEACPRAFAEYRNYQAET